MQNLTFECDLYFTEYMVNKNFTSTRKRTNISIGVLLPFECISILILAVFVWKYKLQRQTRVT